MIARIVPAELLLARRPQRLLERQWMINKAGGWTIVVSGFVEPLLYLLSIRIGLAELVGSVESGGRTLTYTEFVAPALLAASAMNGAVYESTNVFFKLRYDKTYEVALATPLTSGDVAIAEVLYATLRGSLYSAAFLLTMWALGMTASPWAVLMLPVAALTAFAFSAVAIAGVTYMRTWADFEFAPSLLLPMFLFSATFYPLSSYGDLAFLAQISPLYHAVVVMRGLNVGTPTWSMLPHVVVLLVLAAIGAVVTARRIGTLLLK